MPKRKADKIEYYKNKIKKLQNESQNRHRRVIEYSSSSLSDSEANQYVGTSQNEVMHNTTHTVIAARTEDLAEVLTSEVHPSEQPLEVPELDVDLLLALEDATDEQPGFGENIHQFLAQRWLPILKKELAKEVKEKLLKEYLIPENCNLLKAPTLNAEISAAVVDVVPNRDKNILIKQYQLGQGIATISKAITLLLLGDDKVQAIKVLTDGCRILTNLHYDETQVRNQPTKEGPTIKEIYCIF
ncbi:unnamed protein product [Chilo suppressalis]|uniref:Uncharacterized protein n=1 Tax=Chilo suppressalis TaxID=168631 RepID=A0ABN8AVM8_CHISP|nr:unnamed protein product [Chilo suppressalis]